MTQLQTLTFIDAQIKQIAK